MENAKKVWYYENWIGRHASFYLKNPLRHPVVFTYYLQHYFKSYFVLILGDNDAKRLLLEQNGTAHMMQVLSMATHENLIEIALKVFQVRKFSKITNW